MTLQKIKEKNIVQTELKFLIIQTKYYKFQPLVPEKPMHYLI